MKNIDFIDGEVLIDLDILNFDQWHENILQEIREHLEKYPEVKNIHQKNPSLRL